MSVMTTTIMVDLLALAAAVLTFLVAYGEIRSFKKHREHLMGMHDRPISWIESIFDKLFLPTAISEFISVVIRLRKHRRQPSSSPPPAARVALRFLVSYKDQEAIVGDLHELYLKIQAEDGPLVAKRWYCWQVIVLGAVRLKGIVRWGVLAAIGKSLRRFIP